MDATLWMTNWWMQKLVDTKLYGWNWLDATIKWLDLELNGLGHTQARTHTDDGPDMTFSADTNQDKDPFCLSKGPVTRSQTRRLKKINCCFDLLWTRRKSSQGTEPTLHLFSLWTCLSVNFEIYVLLLLIFDFLKY